MPIQNDPLEEGSTLPDNTQDKNNEESKETSFESLLESTDILPEEEKLKEEIYGEQKVHFANVEDFFIMLRDGKYDYCIIEPTLDEAFLSLRSNGREIDRVKIAYSQYNMLLFALKKQNNLIVEEISVEQEGRGKIDIKNTAYLTACKTHPTANGEKIWIKIKENPAGAQAVKKTPPGVIFGFIGSILLVGLILAATFISFVILNAQTLDDVRFFRTLGISLTEINAFISSIVSVIFSILLFVFTSAFMYFGVRFLTTKKIYRRKKITYGIVAALLLILSFSTGSAWMFIDNKVRNLPNWQELEYGDLKIYENDLRIQPDFKEEEYMLSNTLNLIGPVNLQFDIQNYQDRKQRQNISIERYLWKIGNIEQETFSPELLINLDQVGNYPLSVEAIGKDIVGVEFREEIPNLPAVSLSEVIVIEETETPNGGKRIQLDASSLSGRGTIEWYFKSPSTAEYREYEDWEKVSEGEEFFPGKIFFETLYIGVGVRDEKGESFLEKVIIITPNGASNLEAKLDIQASYDDDLSYSFQVLDAQTGFGDGFIESYIFEVEERTYKAKGSLSQENASEVINHRFSKYGSYEVVARIQDSRGNEKTVSEVIEIQKNIKLTEGLEIIDEQSGEKVENIRHDSARNQYIITEFGAPGKLMFRARNIRTENVLYTLKDVEWDIDADGQRDGTGKQFSLDIPTAGSTTLQVFYTFQHRANPDDTLRISETVFIESERKEAVLDLKIEHDTPYVPVIVRFDASKSYIRDDDIIKFIYDYGNGQTEERDAINPGHKYTKAGEYTIKLTAIGSRGGRYSTEKKLVLLPPPQKLNISASMLRAPAGQGIDFSSAGSLGQISEFFWDFGDGNVSTQANPSHRYTKSGRYTVTLRANYVNFNTIETQLEIEIF